MPERLSLDRFSALADAYGSDIARWPQAERAPAREMEFDLGAQAILDRAAALDDALDQWRAPASDAALVIRIEASAPRYRNTLGRRRARLWWSAVALAATLAGAGAGALAASAVASAADVPSGGGTAFGDLDGQDG